MPKPSATSEPSARPGRLPTFAALMSFRSFLLLLLPALVGCHSPVAEKPADPTTVSVRDDLGRTVRVPAHPRRVLPLAPSMTEMVWAVADPAQIVGRTQNCNYPAAALGKQVVNTYPLDLEGVLKLKPDLVLTVEGMTSPGHVAQLEKLGIPVYQQAYDSVADIPRALQDLGRLLGRAEKGKHVADSLRHALEHLRPLPPEAVQVGPRHGGGVLAITWTDPIYVYGYPTLFTDVLRWLRLENAVPASIPQPYPVLPRETVLKLNPDVIIGGDFAGLDTTLFRRYPELKQVTAYRTRRVYAIDDDLLSRPTPRIGLLMKNLLRVLQTDSSHGHPAYPW